MRKHYVAIEQRVINSYSTIVPSLTMSTRNSMQPIDLDLDPASFNLDFYLDLDVMILLILWRRSLKFVNCKFTFYSMHI